MTSKRNDPRYQLRKLSAMYIEDLLKTPDEALLAEASSNGSLEDAGDTTQAAYQTALKITGQRRLQKARQAIEADINTEKRHIVNIDAHAARRLLQKLSANDAEFSSKLTLAARNMNELTDAEVLEIFEDLQQLGAIFDLENNGE